MRNLGQGLPDAEKRAALKTLTETSLAIMNCPARWAAQAYAICFSHTWPPFNADCGTVEARTDYAAKNRDGFCEGGKGPPTLAYGHSPTYAWPCSNVQFTGLTYARSELPWAEIQDGTRNTYLVAEKYVNAPEYRWKKMVGPPDRRPPYRGFWYPYSTNGWGILDFLNLCEAMGIAGIPAFNLNETPQDMADFVQ